MGVDINFYIEVKDKEGKWNLVKWLSKVDKEYDSEEDIVSINGEQYTMNYLKWLGYSWRDELGYGGMLNEYNHSIPTDISSELQSILDKEYEKEKEYLTKIYGEIKEPYKKYSCIYLNEMWEIVYKRREEWEKRTLKAMAQKDINEVNAKLDRIEKLVRGEEVKKSKKKKSEDVEFYEDSLDYYFEEAFTDLLSLYRETNELMCLAKSYLDSYWPDTENIRVIYYCE